MILASLAVLVLLHFGSYSTLVSQFKSVEGESVEIF